MNKKIEIFDKESNQGFLLVLDGDRVMSMKPKNRNAKGTRISYDGIVTKA